MKHLSIIIILILYAIVAILLVQAYREQPTCGLTDEQRHALPYLIDNMEIARDTHQQFVDGNNAYSFWVEKHQQWVDIYEEIIGILEVLE